MKDRITVSIIWHDHRKPITLSLRRSVMKKLLLAGVMFLFLIPGLLLWGALNHMEKGRLKAQQEQVREEKKRLEEEAKRLSQMKEKIHLLESTVLSLQSYLRERGIRLEDRGAKGGGSAYAPHHEDRLDALLQLAHSTYRILRETPAGYPVRGKVTSSFGWRKNPFGRGYEFHTGIDIDAPYGSPVVATADGQVTFVGRLRDYGETVIVKHSSGYQTLYAHLSSAEVREGQRVKAGQVLGRVGSTGRSTGAHLHYEIILENRSVDPAEFLGWR